MIERTVKSLGIKDIFVKSQTWDGFERACDSWHHAYWKWVDQAGSAKLRELLKDRPIDLSQVPDKAWSKLPCAEAEKESWLIEQTRQEILQQAALFRLAMRGPEAEDIETYKMFSDEMHVAALIGDDTYFMEIAKQKQRKRTKDIGDRRLKYQLLLLWVPGCLWASTKDGIGRFLNENYPRSGNKSYDNKTIADARRDLNLYYSPRPLCWGVAINPPRLIPLK
ncbi:MAG: hypothetical protein L0Y58_01485 [Verrucomicrobia subdivision 3 bacterium]|nr:hypothetical protein [Limisphaerales bacterium]